MERAERLDEIREEMKELLREAMGLVRGTDEEDRARGYWYGNIRMSLDDDHDYLSRGGSTIADAVEALREAAGDEDEDEVADLAHVADGEAMYGSD